MQYRINPKTGDKISVIGLGTSYISEASERDAVEALELAYESGINYADLATAGDRTFGYYGKALAAVRKNMLYQVHFGAYYDTGEYGWTTELDTVKRSVDFQLRELKTDYIDYGFIHCIDSEADSEAYKANGVLQYLLDMKKQGVVRHIGLSSHTPAVANKILDLGIAEMLMFSINPGYDYQHGEYAHGAALERMDLYRRCEAEGIGISVMKPFSGGQLLDAKTSPFGEALSVYQCIQYALDRPAVLTVLPGIATAEDVRRLLRFFEISDSEKDYSVISSFTPKDMNGVCVYCNHCQPCPAGIDIGLVNKYYDLALAGDDMAAEHYRNLSVRADACLKCGHCESRCPFKVKQERRMDEICGYFKA